MNAKIYLVGGAVRDSLMGIKNKDKDYVVECESFDAMRQLILDRGGKIFLETPKFLTIRALMPELGAADYVLARKDGEYKDGRHPETVQIGTIFDDLARRDFTMNAIAIDTDNGNILDPHDGQKDIADGLIRCVGSPSARFNEDRLRVFRALRFSITKSFRIHTEIDSAIGRLTPMQFDSISTERIREELLKMFQFNTVRAFNYLMDYPVLWDVVVKRGIWFEPTTKGKG